MKIRTRLPALALALAAVSAGVVAAGPPPDSRPTIVRYDSFDRPGGYTLQHYQQKWSNPYGLGEMADVDTRTFGNGTFAIDAAPFTTGADFSVFDHIKYLAISNDSFTVPTLGAITFAATIDAETPGTQQGRIVHGTYGPPGSYPDGLPYQAEVLEGQQAGATLHMIDFATGQLFDWFVSGSTAFTLIERLPSNVTGSPTPVGRDKMYTQIIDEVDIGPGAHTVAIRYTRDRKDSRVEYFLDGRSISRVSNVGVPLDVQGVPYTGVYPSLGAGENLAGHVNTVAIGHGLFSLLDAFPFQHPDAPELSVSIPLEERLFGQGATATFDDIVVIIDPARR